jgi:hypothetical protein
VAIEDAIAALPEYWEDVVTRLGTAKSEELRGSIAAMGGPDHMAAVARIADLMVEGLPPEHPIRRALLEGELFASATLDWPAVTEALRGRAEGLLVGEQHPGEQTIHPGEQIIRHVASRLLGAPALTEEEVRRRGADPADPGLIRLDRPDGGAQWPAFQFAPGSGPWSVVREVNYLLDAAAYPLGAADWWLSRNGWLDDQPSLLIGQVPDDRLIRAARAIRSEV